MAIMTDSQARRWEYELVAVAAGCVVFAVLAATLFRGLLADSPAAIPVGPILTVVAFGFLALAVLAVGLAWVHHRWFFSARQRLRRDLGEPAGWLDERDLRDSAGAAAVRREADDFWHRPPGSSTTAQAGWVIGELISGRWTVRSQRMYAPYPRSVGIVGPQGSRKSQLLMPLVLDAPGPAVVTSTKDELIAATAKLRAERVGPVYVFDPLGLTGLHNFPFDPVWGCARVRPDGSPDSYYADAIAAAMMRGASVRARALNEELWSDAGRELLRCYLLAADLLGAGSQKVQEWAHHPENTEPRDTLRASPERVPGGWLTLMEKRLADPDKMRAGYFATIVSCTDYLAHAGGARACQRPRGQLSDNIAGFLDQRSTLYIVGDKMQRGIASMMTALAESMVLRARERAVARGGRLAEPLSLFLDEVANLTPVDLPTWAAETRGWGIMVVAVIQSRAQLDETWGREAAEVIWDNLVTKVVLGALGKEEFLESLSRLAGERRVAVPTDSTRGGAQSQTRLERVIPLHVIRSLPPNHAFVLGAARHPAVVRFEPGYERLERERTGAAWRPSWPRWWRHPLRAFSNALELDGTRP